MTHIETIKRYETEIEVKDLKRMLGIQTGAELTLTVNGLRTPISDSAIIKFNWETYINEKNKPYRGY